MADKRGKLMFTKLRFDKRGRVMFTKNRKKSETEIATHSQNKN